MFTEFAVVKVSPYLGEKKADRHGVQNVWLTPLCGKIPNQVMVVAGTVAAQEGNKLESGKNYLISITERDSDPVYGRQFNITVVTEVAGTEVFGYVEELGKAVVVATRVADNGPANILENNTQPAANTGATPAKVDLQSGLEETPVVALTDTTAVVVEP